MFLHNSYMCIIVNAYSLDKSALEYHKMDGHTHYSLGLNDGFSGVQ